MLTNKKSEKKCIALHLPDDLIQKINKYKEITGRSQNGILRDFIEEVLNNSGNSEELDKVFYFVKVRIDTSKMLKFGQKL